MSAGSQGERTCGFACKYAPVALLAGCGVAPVKADWEADDLSPADALLHPNMCSYSKALVCGLLEGRVSGFLFTNCCDSLRRTFDVVRREGLLDFCEMVDLPHKASAAACELFASRLSALLCKVEEAFARDFDLREAAAFIGGGDVGFEGDAILVEGARVEPSLMEQMRAKSPVSIVDGTCTGACLLGPVPGDAMQGREQFLRWYAEALLSQTPCARMVDSRCDAPRGDAIEQNPLAVVYHGVKFCDYYSYGAQEAMRRHGCPVVKVETDWQRGASGQVLTRLEALFESTCAPSADCARDPNESHPAESREEAHCQVIAEAEYFAGVDSGSTSTDAVIVDANGDVVGSSIRATGAVASMSAEAALDDAARAAGISRQAIARIVATGYGRAGWQGADEQVTEITCHARGAFALAPDCRTVIDIGGQDSKAIKLGPGGSVAGFAMNDKCAAGTGRFLEAMARTLELSLADMATLGLSWDEEIALTTMCTVFAESEVISLIAQNKRTKDIVHGINNAVASKTATLVSRVGGAPSYVMTGGVAQNAGVVKALQAKLRAEVLVPQEAQLCGALGAALIAREHMLGSRRQEER